MALLVSIKAPFLLKILWQDEYIAGKYLAKSYSKEYEDVPIHKETIKIKQNLLETTIAGWSKLQKENDEDELFASWVGKLVDGKVMNTNFL